MYNIWERFNCCFFFVLIFVLIEVDGYFYYWNSNIFNIFKICLCLFILILKVIVFNEFFWFNFKIIFVLNIVVWKYYNVFFFRDVFFSY